MSDPITRLNATLDGRYRIERQLGEGGMATVYLAVQTHPIRREVALKVLKESIDNERVVTRFEAERQTLAMMEHPSIAHVIDAGRTKDGRSFFVMELVRGEPLTKYADRRRLTVQERVRLFVQVCEAVQHAHQKGIVHRDLKPSNILVTETDGSPLAKVIDFGIAHAVESVGEESVRLTQSDETIGTPAYMSPEQFEGVEAAIDTRSDIYALGVVLYELLVGSLPFESSGYRGFAAIAAALLREPPTPSRRLEELADTQETVAELRRSDVRTLRAELAGDLDWIVLMAIDKEPHRRYATANGLALDLERYLAHEPVRARPPSTGYRARKFVRRNRAASALGAALILALVAFGAAQAFQVQQTREARDLADARRAQAEALVERMLGDLRTGLEPLGRLDLLDEVGQAAVEYFAALPEEEFSDDELLSRARSLYQIGEVRLNEGRAADARDAMEQSLRLVRELSARSPDDIDRLFELSQAQFWAGLVAWRADDLETAEDRLVGYGETTERLVELDPDRPLFRIEAGYAHGNLGSVLEAKGDLDGAVSAYRRTIGAIEDLVRQHPDSVEWLGNLAESHNKLGLAYRKLGRYREALDEHMEELAIKERVLDKDPHHSYWRYRFAIAHYFLGEVRRFTGDIVASASSYERAAAALDSLVDLDPSNHQWRRDAALTLSGLARSLELLGRTAQARVAFDDARRMIEPATRDTSSFDFRFVLGTIEVARAEFLEPRVEPVEILAATEEAGRLLGEAPPSDVNSVGSRITNDLVRSSALEGVGRAREARELRLHALERATAVAGVEQATADPWLARVYLALNRPAEAAPVLTRLWDGGYADPSLVALARAHGLGP